MLCGNAFSVLSHSSFPDFNGLLFFAHFSSFGSARGGKGKQGRTSQSALAAGTSPAVKFSPLLRSFPTKRPAPVPLSGGTFKRQESQPRRRGIDCAAGQSHKHRRPTKARISRLHRRKTVGGRQEQDAGFIGVLLGLHTQYSCLSKCRLMKAFAFMFRPTCLLPMVGSGKGIVGGRVLDVGAHQALRGVRI